MPLNAEQTAYVGDQLREICSFYLSVLRTELAKEEMNKARFTFHLIMLNASSKAFSKLTGEEMVSESTFSCLFDLI